MPEVTLDKQGSAKVQLLLTPPAMPGQCSCCGYSGGEDRKFIDLGLSIDYYGAVFFCTTCVISMGSVLGFVTPAVYDEVATTLQEAVARLVTLELENERLRTAFGILGSNGASSDSVLPRLFRDEDVDVSAKADSVITEHASKQGPDDVSSDASDSDSGFFGTD